jgi:cation diffusion facilitator CzcD-associated flavoprotein CzcO
MTSAKKSPTMITPEINDARAYSAATAQQLGWERVNKRGYEILEQPYGLHSQKRIVVVGAGATGICMAKFVESIPNLDIQIYEKNDDLAGTWWENRYPGCACDIPAHIYQFMWALNPNWSSYYVPADEILRYMHKVIEEHDLRKYVKVQHKVISARWDSATSKWNLVLELPNGTTVDDECDFLLNAAGLLNNWKWPDIKGLQSFEGNLTHSAAYDTSIDLTNKRVAVFGSGSSGVQIVAKSQPIVEHLYTWIRSPIWLSGGFASSFAGPDGANFQYSDEVKKRFAEDPEFHLRYVKMLEAELGVRFNYNLTGTEEAKTAVKYAKEQMERKLESLPGLAEKIIPTTYGIGCRRPTPGNGYLEALASSNVTTYVSLPCIFPFHPLHLRFDNQHTLDMAADWLFHHYRPMKSEKSRRRASSITKVTSTKSMSSSVQRVLTPRTSLAFQCMPTGKISAMSSRRILYHTSRL